MPEEDDPFPEIEEEYDSIVQSVEPIPYDSIEIGQVTSEKSVVLELHVYRPGMFKKVNPKNLIKNGIMINDDGSEEIVDPKMFSVSKRLIDKKDLKLIYKVSRKFLKELKEKCAKCSMLHSSMFILPNSMIMEVDELVIRVREDMEACLNMLEHEYEDMKTRQAERLGPEFNSADYPPFEEWRKAWRIETMLWTFDVPKALKSIDRDLYIHTAKKVQMMWADYGEQVRDNMRTETLEAIQYFIDITGDDPETGKPRYFTAPRAEKLKQFFHSLEAHDITNDTQTVELARQAKLLLSGITPKEIRKSKDLREGLHSAFSGIKEEASKILVVRERKFSPLIEEPGSEETDLGF
jgi:hypothetical protein